MFCCRLASQLVGAPGGGGPSPAALQACAALAEHLEPATLLSAATRVRSANLLCTMQASLSLQSITLLSAAIGVARPQPYSPSVSSV